MYTRPTLDLYIANKYWNFISKDLDDNEIKDLQKAKEALEHYEKLYSIMEYGNDLTSAMTCLETRVAQNNPSVPMTIYRKVTIAEADGECSQDTTSQRKFSRRWRSS